MKINNLHVDGFGVWKGLDVDNLSSDMTVFHGYNEAGKTTLMQFVRSMMFGFDNGRLAKYTPPVYGGLAGGAMDITMPNGAWEVVRNVDPNRLADPIGDLTVTDQQDGSVHGNAQLTSLLTDVDESIFNNVFAIGLREIQELSALNSTAASNYLYRLTSGLDRVSLIDVMRDLNQRRESIWSADPKDSSRLQVLTDRRQKLLREIDDLRQKSKRWSRIASETTDVDNQLSDLRDQLKQAEKECRMIEIATQISDRWQNRIVVRDQIAAYSGLPAERDLNVSRLDELNEKIALQRERIDQTRGQRKQIKSEALSLPINRELWAQKARIEAISEHAPWVQSLERQHINIQEEIDRIENTLVGEVDGLGLKIRARDVNKLGSGGFHQLEEAGKKLTDSQDDLEQVRQDLEKSEFDLGQHSQRLTKSQGDTGSGETLEETSAYVNRLKRRVELEQKIEKLTRTQGDLDRDIDSVVSNQVIPVEKLSIIGVVFILGFVFLFLGLISMLTGSANFANISQSSGLLFLIIGFVGLLLSLAIKYHCEHLAKEELDDYRHQVDIVRQQLKRAKLERNEIEKHLPAHAITQYDMALEEAQGKLNRLTDLVPLQNRVENTRMGMDDLRRRLAVQQRSVESASKIWQQTLKASGLPVELEPHQLREIMNRRDRIAGYNTRLEQLRSEQEQKVREINTIRQRIDSTIHETGILSGTTHGLHSSTSGHSLDPLHSTTNPLHTTDPLLSSTTTLHSTDTTRQQSGKKGRKKDRSITRGNTTIHETRRGNRNDGSTVGETSMHRPDGTRLDEHRTSTSTTRTNYRETTHLTNGMNVSDRLTMVTRAINEQRVHVKARKELANRYKSLRTRLNKSKRELDRQLGFKQRLLSTVGAESEAAFREMAAKHTRRRKLKRKEADLNDQIQLATGKHFTNEDMGNIFSNFGTSGLEKHWEQLQLAIDEAREEQNRLMQLRGELMQEVKALGEDSRLDVVRLELNSIEAEISKLKTKWQELGASSQMLEMIRESYESKRQPETLKEASNYLTKLSEGKYVRIWTRMTGEELLVDNANDETLPVENLSRGTREAVFLSLRLALVGAYARRGAVVPMVLDDVLVNFDGQRARSAAEVLYDFSRNGYQILMFTCHDHIRDIFHSLGADVRILPAHKDVFDSSAKPIRYGDEEQRYDYPSHIEEPQPTFAPPVQFETTQEPYRIPVEYVAPMSQIDLAAGAFDEALRYELSAVASDQQREHQLRSDMVFIPTTHPTHEIMLSGNDPIWRETSPVIHHT